MTLNDLKVAVLRKLKVIPAHGDARPADMELIGDKYAALHALLLDDELVSWGVADDIPVKLELPMINMLAAFAADDFGVPEPRATTLKLEGALDLSPPSLAEKQLRRAISGSYISSRLRTEYF